MNDSNNYDLFSASLESIDSSKRVDKYQRFKNDFQRECNATLDNAQEWIKTELPMDADHIDAIAIKDELKRSKISNRRKHLLSALLFEKSVRESIENNHASKAAIMAIHMCNHMWQARIELHGSLPATVSSDSSVSAPPDNSAIETHDDSRAKILTTLIEKSRNLEQHSQLQSQIESKLHAESKSSITDKSSNQTPEQTPSDLTANKPASTSGERDLWAQEAESTKQQKLSSLAKNDKPGKKHDGIFAKVKTRLPLKRKNKADSDQIDKNRNQTTESSPNDSLLDNPNRSSIMVSSGFLENIDDSLIREAYSKFPNDPDESCITIHKPLKERSHEKQTPGSNTIIMKLASSVGKRPEENLTIPEQCQQAVNILTQQFPGFDSVAIRNMAAQRVGVSLQYIENLNILPEQM